MTSPPDRTFSGDWPVAIIIYSLRGASKSRKLAMCTHMNNISNFLSSALRETRDSNVSMTILHAAIALHNALAASRWIGVLLLE